jgi:tripartite-type tricarboxylate transporter receptor subunit TctC
MMNGSRGGLSRREILKHIGAIAGGIAISPFMGGISPSFAQYPASRPVRIIVGASAGGPADLAARFIAPLLQERLGGNFIVENRPGGGANIGMQAVIRAEPDGHTLHVGTNAWVINPSLHDPPVHDAFKDLVPVVEIAISPTLIVVRSDSGINSLGDLIAMAKKDPDKFNIAVPPISSTQYLAAETLKFREGLGKIALIVHPGGGQAIQALLSGTVQACSSSLAPAQPHIAAGTLKGLAVLGEARWPALPDIGTAEELGFKDYNFETYVAMMAPAKTPPDIVKQLEKAALEGLTNPGVGDRMLKGGFQVVARNAEQHAARISREFTMFQDIINKAGIRTR